MAPATKPLTPAAEPATPLEQLHADRTVAADGLSKLHEARGPATIRRSR
jgi:hypothetical protein